jgi:antirestriction protein
MENKVYVGTYAKYNAGSIAGAWLNLADYEDKAAFFEACRKLHSDENDPELMFQDWEGLASAAVSECDIEGAAFELRNLEKHELEAVEAFIALSGCGLEESIETALDGYGCYDSPTEWAESELEACGDVPSHLQGYIDFESYARDNLPPTSGYHGKTFWVFHN